MKKLLAIIISLISINTVQAASCPAPTPDVSTLFGILDGPSTQKLSDIKTFLSSHPVAVDALNTDCETPLLHAIKKHEYDIFSFLYNNYGMPDPANTENGADSSICNYGIEYGDWSLISFLKNTSKCDMAWNNELIDAADSGTIETIKKLIQVGVKLNYEDTYGNTALINAAKDNQNIDVTKALIQAGADVNYSTSNGGTALIYAAGETQNVDVINVLIQAGADVNHVAVGGVSALINAARDNQNVEVINLLLRAGAVVNHLTSSGVSALMTAVVYNQNVGVIKALIQAGAEVNHTDPTGRSVLFYAQNSLIPNPVAVQTIVDAGGR